MTTHTHLHHYDNTHSPASPWQHTLTCTIMTTRTHLHHHDNTHSPASPWQHTLLPHSACLQELNVNVKLLKQDACCSRINKTHHSSPDSHTDRHRPLFLSLTHTQTHIDTQTQTDKHKDRSDLFTQHLQLKHHVSVTSSMWWRHWWLLSQLDDVSLQRHHQHQLHYHQPQQQQHQTQTFICYIKPYKVLMLIYQT